VPAEDRHGKQGESGLAHEYCDRPRQSDRVRATQALDHHRAHADHHCCGQHPGAWAAAFEQRSDRGQRDGHARHCDGEHRRFGVARPVHERDVEHDQAADRNADQPQPVGSLWSVEPSPGQAGPCEEQDTRDCIAQCLGGVQWRVGQNTGHRDAAADERHSE
jgi:hypothetical protein